MSLNTVTRCNSCTKDFITALKYWEAMFKEQSVHDDFGDEIAEVLYEKAHELEVKLKEEIP